MRIFITCIMNMHKKIKSLYQILPSPPPPIKAFFKHESEQDINIEKKPV